MNKFLLSLLTTSCGLCAGILLSGQINNVGKTFAMAGTMSAPLVFVAHVISDSKAEKRIREIQKKADKSASELPKMQSELSRIESYNRSLLASLESVKKQLATCESAKVKAESMFDTLAPIAAKSERELNSAKSRISELLEQIEDLQAVCEQWELRFDSELALHVEQQLKELRRGELSKIFDDHDALTQQASEIIHRFQNWAETVALKHEAKRQLIVNLSERYSENINEANESFDKEKESYLREIEGLHEKVARLQQELSGGLLEPELVDAKYNPDLDLGNSLCRQIFYQVKIPLRFYLAYTSEDGITHLGFMTSRGADREAIAYRINSESKAVADALGLYKIESVAASDVLEGIEIRARRSRPQALSEDAIYRIMERPQACTGILRDAMNHRKAGKPTLRIMSGTGGGKSLVAKVFIADWVKTQSGEVWLSDPMDGSEEDYWQIPKAARSAREGSALLGEFVGEFNARKNKSSNYKDVLVLGVFDEFDKQHPDSDKEKVQKVWTAIRHHQMNLILMGQSSEVGVNGWTWDEMKNCSLLFVGDAITTAIKQAKNIGLSQATKRQIERNYDAIRLYLEDKNKGLDSDVMYRVALLVVGEKFKFLELPSALKGSIENDSAAIVDTPWGSVVSPPITSEITTAKKRPNCPVCGSEKVRKCGDRWKCENSDHTKNMGVKSWKITNS